MILSCLSLILAFFIQPGQAEYRVYRLNVMKGETKVREVMSTLDHVQYPDYYPLGSGERLEYADSWMCWGRSEAFDPPCSPPDSTEADPAPVRKPSSNQ